MFNQNRETTPKILTLIIVLKNMWVGRYISMHTKTRGHEILGENVERMKF